MSSPLQDAVAFLELCIEARETQEDSQCNAFLARIYRTQGTDGLCLLIGALGAMFVSTLVNHGADMKEVRAVIAEIGISLALTEEENT